MHQLLKFLRLPTSDRQLLVGTFMLLGLVRLGLWLLPFQKLQELLRRVSQVGIINETERSQNNCRTVDTVIWAVHVSSHYMPGRVKCLARALTTQVITQRQGYSPELRIGVAKGESGQLEAHAWVELQGRVVMGFLQDLDRFSPMPSLCKT